MARNWFPKIETNDDAKSLSKQGAIGVLVFFAMNLLGVFFAVYLNRDPVNGGEMSSEAIFEQLLGSVILLPLLLVFAWRIYIRKGWLVAGIVLTWFCVEIAFKVLGGTTNIGWMIAYVAVASMIFNGLRACWWTKKATNELDSE